MESYIESLVKLINSVGNGDPDWTKWIEQRTKTIKSLKEFNEKLTSVSVSANKVKFAGYSTELAGAASAGIGTLLALFGVNRSSDFINVGSIAQNAGSLMTRISDLIESHFSEQYLQEINAVLEDDQLLSDPLSDIAVSSCDLDASVKRIFGVSLTSGKLHTLTAVFNNFLELLKSGKDFEAIISRMRQGNYSIYIGNDVIIDRLKELYDYLSSTPTFENVIKPIFNISEKKLQCMVAASKFSAKFMEMSSDVSTLRGGLNPEIPTKRQVSVFCLFQAIIIAKNFIGVINAKKIIENGTSIYSDKINSLINALDSELDCIKRQASDQPI